MGPSGTPKQYRGDLLEESAVRMSEANKLAAGQNHAEESCTALTDLVFTRCWGVQEAPGGLLRTRQATYDATKKMVASLDDKYTEFLPPSQVTQSLQGLRP